MSNFEIDDTGLPCTAAGIGGTLVEESAEVIDICQDPDNLNIIYAHIRLTGAFDYTLSTTVIFNSVGINIANHLVPFYKGEGVGSGSIVTNCGSITILVAHDLGSAISQGYGSFNNIREFHFSFKFFGSPVSISQNPIAQQVFQSIDPTAEATFYKGLTPEPYRIYFDENSNRLRIQYINMGDSPCLCAINCITPTQEEYTLTVCEDEIQEIEIDANSIVGDPTNVQFTFVDSIGNQSTVDVNSMVNVNPLKMFVQRKTKPFSILVGFSYLSTGHAVINKEKVQYQILKYINNIDNNFIWKDWSSEPRTEFIDTDIKSSLTYGYAIRFRGEFGEVSNLSAWSVIVAS